MRNVPAKVALALSLAALTVPARAGFFTYMDVGSVSVNNIAFTNIYESTPTDITGMVYGQPAIDPVSHDLIFPYFEPGNITSSSSNGTGDSSSVFISFDVTVKTALLPSVFEQEWGDFTQVNLNPADSGGTGKVSGILTLMDLANTETTNQAALSVTPNQGFGNGVFTTEPQQPNLPLGRWDANALASLTQSDTTTFQVTLENNLQTISATTGTVLLDKKSVAFSFPGVPVIGEPNSPEPASLSLLAMGSLFLMRRRSSR